MFSTYNLKLYQFSIKKSYPGLLKKIVIKGINGKN
jgi:hypothetical protein